MHTINVEEFVQEPVPAEQTVAVAEAEAESEEPPADVNVPDAIPAAAAMAIPDARVPRGRAWPKIESITVENFKAIEATTIPIGNVTILVGPNGSGKSSALQAIHWAARAASYIKPKDTSEVLLFERIDYLPSSEPLRTAHKGELKSGRDSTPVTVKFQHAPLAADADKLVATVEIYGARNKGGITAHISGDSAVTPYKQRTTFITAYIPGLAGLSERETLLAQPQLRRQAASGDAGGVLRNVLLNLATKTSKEEADEGQHRLNRLDALVSSVHPGFSLKVKFDDREDYNISASYTYGGGDPRSLETAATGVLQVVQIFAYIILFRPKLVLIDEPDAHLHPDKQERLIEALEKAATEFDTQIILTTHSPSIARAASPDAKLVWMKDGKVKSDDDGAIRRLLGWGGLDKHALFFVEDKIDTATRALLRQWPHLQRCLAVCRTLGMDNVPKDNLLRALLVDGELGVNAIIHRDRDFMTDDETRKWAALYKTDGVFPWMTRGCDVESYFCSTAYLSKLFGVPEVLADEWRKRAAANVTGARKTFFEKRKVVTRLFYVDGGGPASEELWNAAGEQCVETVVGKDLLGQLKLIIHTEGYNSKLLDKFTIPEGFELAPDLRTMIESAVA
ncbi:ATP-dependent nuclease [Xanthobacteraceae bacterium A53D]